MKIINKFNKGISFVTAVSFFAMISNSYADFSVTVNKQINIEKDQKIIAKIDGEQKLIEGLLKATPQAENPNIKTVDITWSAILDSKGRVNISNLISTIDLEKKFLTRGTNILVKGSLPNTIKIKTEEEKENEKRNIPITGSTNVNTSGGSNNSPVVDTPISGDLERAEYIKTYDGCPQLFDQRNEIILVHEQIYYINKDGSKVVTQPCTQVKEITATYKVCSDYDDFTARETSKRKQAYFIEDEKEYSAGGCVSEVVYKHGFEYETCDPIIENEFYIKTGRIYYTDDEFENTYLSDCILNPYDEEVKQKLNVDFDNCPVDHSGLESVYFGKYYYMDKENRKHVVSDCMRNYLSQIPHNVEFVKWENFDNDRYALRWQKTYILYPKGSQQYELFPDKAIYITGNEVDKIRYEYTPINIESRVVPIAKNSTDGCTTLNSPKQGSGGTYRSTCENNKKPNPIAIKEDYNIRTGSLCYTGGGEAGQEWHNCTLIDIRWAWNNSRKECNVVYKRPDESTLNLNNWWTLIESWDVNPVNQAVCK